MPPIVGIVDAVDVASGRLMQLARVIGDVVVTRKDENLPASSCSCCSRLPPTASRRPHARGGRRVGAGVGETVFFVRGKEASFPFYPTEVPDRCRHRRHRRSLGSSDEALTADQMRSRVIGTVVSTQKHAKFEGAKLLLVQPLTLDDSRAATALLAVDSVGAGVHEKVLDRASKDARRARRSAEGRAGRRGGHRYRRHGGRRRNDRAGTARAGA